MDVPRYKQRTTPIYIFTEQMHLQGMLVKGIGWRRRRKPFEVGDEDIKTVISMLFCRHHRIQQGSSGCGSVKEGINAEIKSDEKVC